MFFLFLFGYMITFSCASDDIALETKSMIDKTVCKSVCSPAKTDVNITCECNENAPQWKTGDRTLNSPKLLCRESNLLTFKLQDNLTYFIERKTTNDTWRYNQMTSKNIVRIAGLTPNTAYKFRVFGLKNKQVYFSDESKWFNTSISHTDPPKPVEKFFIKNFSLHGREYDVILGWKPSSDMGCFYEFVWFNDFDHTQQEITNPDKWEIRINNLTFDSNYSVGIMVKSLDGYRESEKIWANFTTPHCLDMLKTVDLCVPRAPTGLVTSESDVGFDERGNVILRWNAPAVAPHYYIATFIPFYANQTSTRRNVAGNASEVVFYNVTVGSYYQVSLIAASSAGSSKAAFLTRNTSLIKAIKRQTNEYLSIIVLPILGLLMTCLLIAYIFYRKRMKIFRTNNYFMDFEMKSIAAETLKDDYVYQDNVNDEWEIDTKQLILQSTLGQGAFGVVKKAILQRGGGATKKDVAVKMLLDEASSEDVRAFYQEIEIMKSVGSHPHIVSIIGCCTQRKNLKLIVEYCAKGDLLSYLIKAWEALSNKTKADMEVSNEYVNVTLNFTNRLYVSENNSTVDILEYKDLVSIARQVAMGMEYLASLRVLHRDLAARNVLVCEDRTVKVCDFGLSRDVYKDNVYCKTTGGKLPIRWLAIESLTHQIYTTQSDIWSYGILLWEIITLGAGPYPGVATHELLDLLKSGYRMKCPNNCTNEIYDIMTNCWNETPKDRPTFTDIIKYLDTILLSFVNSQNDRYVIPY